MRSSALLMWLGGVWAVAALACASTNRHASSPTDVLERALQRVDDDCRPLLHKEFSVGQQLGTECNASRDLVAQTLAKSVPARFGVLEQQLVDLHAMSFIFSEASRCERWPLRVAGHHVLSVAAAKQAGCHVGRLDGTIVLSLMDTQGQRHDNVLHLDVRDGMLRLEVAELDRLLRVRGFNGIDDLRYLEFGHGGYGGWVNVQKLREIRTQLHRQWVVNGRGAPELLLARHPSAAFVEPVAAMAQAVRNERHRRDYAALQRGELSAAAFLWRHPNSPFREQLLRQQVGASSGPSEPTFVESTADNAASD